MLSRLLLFLALPLLGSVATEVKIARSWKSGVLKADVCRTGSEKGFRP